MTATPAPTTSAATSSPRDDRSVLDGAWDSAGLRAFLGDEVPSVVGAALRTALPAGTGPLRCRVTRSTFRPHRKLTAYLDVSGQGLDQRPVVVTWARRSTRTPLHPADPAMPAAAQSPFTALRITDEAAGMTVLVSPLDPLFPQVARLHDPAQLRALLTRVGVPPGTRPSVTTLRYRPRQRHVLVVRADDGGPTLYVKCYRDDTGARAVRRSNRFASALRERGVPATTVEPLAYAEAERLVLWRGVDAPPLSRVVSRSPELAHLAGAALRAIHEDPVPDGARTGQSDPTAEAGATVRACGHVVALAPGTAGPLLALVARHAELLGGLQPESGHRLHGDYKCDNLLVEGARLRLLDFDRVTIGDPALDVGKLCADLRWWAQADDVEAGPLVEAMLDGYGPCPPGRLQRAGHYDVLFQLRAAGRRVPLHEPGWDERVEAVLGHARQTSEAQR
jgi:Phosphotransferase enzyme family